MTPPSGSDLDELNPAWYYRAIQDEANQLMDTFEPVFETNPNQANAFGKCVSRRSHGENFPGAVGGDPQADACEEPADSGSCENDDSASDEPAGHERDQGDDEKGEEDQGQDEGSDASDEGDSSDLSGALRSLRL